MVPIKNSMYEGAPDMLMDAICEVSVLLERTRAKTGENGSYKFWKRMENVMKYAWGYIQNTHWIHRKFEMQETELNYYRYLVPKLQSELLKYTVVEKMMIDGTFERDVEVVTKCMQKGPGNE